MKPVELSVRGFGSYREPQVIDLGQLRLACITGSNGSGKSTLLTSISFAIFGMTRTGDMDEVVTEGEDRAEVALVFDHDGERYRVTRTRTRGKTTAAILERELPEGWAMVGDKGPKAVGLELDRLLGISADTYSSTVLLAQEDSGRFSKADPSTRKKILTEILSLERYTKLAKAARERATETRRTLEDHQRRMDEIDAETADAAALSDELSEVARRLGELAESQGEAEEQLAVAQAALASADASRRRVEALRGQITVAERAATDRRAKAEADRSGAVERHSRAQRAVADAEHRLADARRLAFDLSAVETSLGELRSACTASVSEEAQVIEDGQAARSGLDRLSDEIARCKDGIAELEERRRTLSHDGAACFACHQSLDDRLREQLHDEMDSDAEKFRQRIESLATERQSLERERETLKDKLNELRRARPSEEELAALERKLAVAHTAAESVEGLEVALASAAESVATAVRALAALEVDLGEGDDPVVAGLRKEMGVAEAEVASFSSSEMYRDAAREALQAIASERETITQRKGSLAERLSHYDRLGQEREARAEKTSVCAKDQEDWAGLAKAYGPDGVPNLVFTGVVAELEQDASGLMEDLTNGTMRLALKTTTQNKSDGSVREALDVVVTTPAGERRYGSLSGGERFRVDLALRVALARLLTRRSGSAIEFLALDEGWGSLDPEGINAMLDVLRQLHSEFGLILTVTHTPEVAAAFEARLEVERDTDGTSVVHLVAA